MLWWKRCGKNKTQEETITKSRNLSTVKATVTVPIALIQSDFHPVFRPYKFLSFKDF